MSLKQLSVETVPAFLAKLHWHGGILAFRNKYFGGVFEFGWAWVPQGKQALFGIEFPLHVIKHFNGPRQFGIGILTGVLKLRVGADASLFFGVRDPAIEAQLAQARADFERQIQAAINNGIAQEQQEQISPAGATTGAPAEKLAIEGEYGVIKE